MSAIRILVIDDDAELCELLADYLGSEGFAIEAAHDADSGLSRALEGQASLVVLDVMLPGMSGFEVLRRLREQSRVPVVMLTARGDDVDRIVGLEMGADDYLPKPFNPRELVARIRAVLRRGTAVSGAPGPVPPPVAVGDLELDPATRVVRQRGQPVELTSVEFSLLEALVRDADFEARGRNCSVHVEACEPARVAGIPELLRRAVENVVRNAVRFTTEGTAVEVSLRQTAAGAARIEVRDHGPGLPEASLAEVFRPFYRVADARDRGSGGAGLGLAIAERAVRLHGGTIRAENQLEGGLRVTIELPARTPPGSDLAHTPG